MYTFTNQFNGPALRHRIGMMNQPRSGRAAWGRYAGWAMLLGLMALTCRHKRRSEEPRLSQKPPNVSLTNATRALTNEIDKPGMPWHCQAALGAQERTAILNDQYVRTKFFGTYPDVLCLRHNKLALNQPANKPVMLFINGQESSEKALSTLTFEEVNDLLVYQKKEYAPGADTFRESYRVYISTTHRKPTVSLTRSRWKRYLEAAAVSEHPLGQSNTFTQNELLEAIFFQNRNAFVQRTQDDYLTLIDAFATDIEVFINGLPATTNAIRTVHVREVTQVFARERPFEEWVESPNRKRRFVLYIQTSPQRAKRDSTYYVFSPFYSGDF